MAFEILPNRIELPSRIEFVCPGHYRKPLPLKPLLRQSTRQRPNGNPLPLKTSRLPLKVRPRLRICCEGCSGFHDRMCRLLSFIQRS